MVERIFWKNRLKEAWLEKNIVWLAGVRRSGKTCLCQSLPDTLYFDCELPRTRRSMEDPEGFLEGLQGEAIALDEIHRLPNPSELLKIAADHYPSCRVLATGSSTLEASKRFRDTLTGRKRNVWLTPMTEQDRKDFQSSTLRFRLHRGGLPPFFLAKRFPEADVQEWIDSYWAKDIQELFRLERRAPFQRLLELLLGQSGGMFEATRFAGDCEISRPTVSNYLSILEATYVVHVIRPFSTRKAIEIVSAPKVYGFDTGFVCYFRGWGDLRNEDLGILWEHYVLNEIMATTATRRIHYWRDKAGHEIDFVWKRRGRPPIAIECKWSSRDFSPRNMKSFASRYRKGLFFVVAQDVEESFSHTYGEMTVRFVSIADLCDYLVNISSHLP